MWEANMKHLKHKSGLPGLQPVLLPLISALSQLLPKSMQIFKANSKRADKTLAAGQDVHLLGSVHNPRALGHRLISHVAHPFTDPLEVLHLRVPLVI